MKIGINWECLGKPIPANEQIRLMKENGFEATFLFSQDPTPDELIAQLRAEGIACESMHAPFSGINRMWGDGGEETLEMLKQGVYSCARNRVRVLVVHLSSGEHAPPVNDRGLERYGKLLSCARREGITVAFENQRKLGNLAVVTELFPDAGFCWDIGHEGCFTIGREYMPLFGSRIAALHLHDNPNRFDMDHHMLPYDGKTDLERKALLLAQSGYAGSAMLEVFQNASNAYKELSPEAYFKRAAEAARRFADRVEALRT